MITSEKQTRHRATGTGGRKIVRSAAFCLLLFHTLLAAPSAAAESTYHLVGTVESKGFTGAVILTPDGKQTFYRLRETLPDGAELAQVHDRSISLKGSDGSQYDMFITTSANSGGIVMTSPNVPSSVPGESMPNASKKLRTKSGRVIGRDNDE